MARKVVWKCNTGFVGCVHRESWTEEEFREEHGLEPDEDLEETLFSEELCEVALEILCNHVDFGFSIEEVDE